MTASGFLAGSAAVRLFLILLIGRAAVLCAAGAGTFIKPAEVKLSFNRTFVQPPFDMPREARHAGIGRGPEQPGESPAGVSFGMILDDNSHGAFSNVVAGSISSIAVTWVDEQFLKTDEETKEFM